ncbi:MAG: dihydropteroate synthase [Desulfobacteraceae bacterium]|nr:dihydropteroate synthase [Desulfobacteraceae bacterium]
MRPFSLQWGGRRLELGKNTAIMGVLNITPDSFSDGGQFFQKDAALVQAEKLIADGADILDIGGESSRPFSDPVSAEEETRRVLPVIEHLAGKISVPISIDTTKAEVARRAIEAGAVIINDISALGFDPVMGRVAAQNDVLLVLMHMKGEPRTMQVEPYYDDLIGEIRDFLKDAVNRAVSAGVDQNRIIVDPGIGFGKTVEHNLQIINRIDSFNDLGLPVLLGPSRKTFIRKLLSSFPEGELSVDSPEIETGTQGIVAAAAIKGVHIIRVHNVAETLTTLRVVDSIRNERRTSEKDTE